MTVYVTDLDSYRVRGPWAHLEEAHGAMVSSHGLVGVTGLVEPEALVEIETTAVLPKE